MIREATFADLEEMIVLGYDMHQESRFKTCEYSVEKVCAFLSMAINSDDYLAIVCEKQSTVIGGFVGFVAPHWFSDDLMAGDFALFMHPDHRGGRAAAKLVKRFIDWALEKGVSREFIQPGITTGVEVEKTTKLYEFLGFEKTGAFFTLRAQ